MYTPSGAFRSQQNSIPAALPVYSILIYNLLVLQLFIFCNHFDISNVPMLKLFKLHSNGIIIIQGITVVSDYL